MNREVTRHGKALGKLRRNIAPEYRSMILKDGNVFEAFKKLERHFAKTEAGQQNDLTKQFLNLKLEWDKEMDFYIQEHLRLKNELEEQGMEMTSKQTRAAFVDGLNGMYEIQRYLNSQLKMSWESFLKECRRVWKSVKHFPPPEDQNSLLAGKKRKAKSDKSSVQSINSLLHVVLAAMGTGLKLQKQDRGGRNGRDKPICKGCKRKGHLWEKCFGNPAGSNFKGWEYFRDKNCLLSLISAGGDLSIVPSEYVGSGSSQSVSTQSQQENALSTYTSQGNVPVDLETLLKTLRKNYSGQTTHE